VLNQQTVEIGPILATQLRVAADEPLMPDAAVVPPAEAERKWPPAVRLLFITGSAASLWAGIFWILHA